MFFCRPLAAVLFCLSVATASAAEISQLEGWLPPDVNAVSIVRVGQLMQSPRAIREDWAKSADAQFLAGAMTLPSDVDLYVRGSHLFPGMSSGNWSVALLAFSRAVDMQRIARHEGATVQMVSGRPAVMSRRNAYFALLDTQLIGVVSPAYRQQLSRLIQRGGRDTAGRLSSYLSEATADVNVPIVLAMDLTDMFEPEQLKLRLAASSMMRTAKADLDRVAELCMHLRGVRLNISVDERTEAMLSIDFNIDVGADAPLVRSLLLEVLADMGASIDAFDNSLATARGQSVQLSTVFDDMDLRRVMSLVTSPHSMGLDMPPSSEQPTAPGPRISLEASRKYFKAVDQILADLRHANAKAKDYYRTATWHENFAAKIDQLPIVSVDPELIEFGQSVSSDLRAVAASLRGVAVEVDTLQDSVTYNTTVTPGWEAVSWWGGYGAQPAAWNTTSNLEEVRERQAGAISAGAQDREQIWLMITNGRTRTLNSMIQKFGSDFAKGIKK